MLTTTGLLWLSLAVATSMFVACGATTVRDGPTGAGDGPQERSSDRHVASYTTDAPMSLEATGGPAFRGIVATRCSAILPLVRVKAMEHQLDIGLLAGIIRVESGFRKDAKSGAGARGLMQVMPTNGRRLKCGNLYDPHRNMECGIEVLTRFLRHYDNDLVYALSAYNAGYRIPNAAKKEGSLPSNVSYVEAVLSARASYLQHGCGGS